MPDFPRALLDRRIAKFEGRTEISVTKDFIVLVCLITKTLQQRRQEARLDEGLSFASNSSC